MPYVLPALRDDEPRHAIRTMMDIALTFDHRLIDGAMGARFLQRLKEYLQSYDPDMQL